MSCLPQSYALFAYNMSGSLLTGKEAKRPPSQRAPVTGFVTDLAEFEQFIAERPDAAQFHAAYPDVRLILPGGETTRELRLNRSRYFAELDHEGRITGGKFQ